MKLIHLSDLHLGKRVYEQSMLADQAFILDEILSLIDAEKPDAVLIAGDVYDKAIPPAEAVQLFDDFLVRLADRRLETFVISGNHDSPERIAFGSHLMDLSGVHLSPVYDGKPRPFTLRDEYGPVHIWMLPFIKPAHVRRFCEEELAGYTDALREAVRRMEIDPDARNVLVTHQFVTGARRAESEEVSVGGSDAVAAAVFAPFDYVALGHLHTPQNCGTGRIRYCGTPLKYSFSEAKDEKSVTLAELREKGSLSVRALPLKPLRELVELRGSYEALTLRSFYEHTTWQEDYTHITLTDEQDIPGAVGKLRAIYRHLLRLDYDNARTRALNEIEGAGEERRSPFELFAEFYELQNNQALSEEQADYLRGVIEKTWEDGQ